MFLDSRFFGDVALVALVGLVVLVGVVIALGRVASLVGKAHDAGAADVVALARERGWQVAEGPAAAAARFPASLAAEQITVDGCDLVVTGPEFEAQSWAVRVRNAGGLVPVGAARQHVVRVPGPSGVRVLLRPFPRPAAPMLLPRVFKGAMVEDGPRGFLTGGDWSAVASQLEPLVPEIGRHEWWVVVDDGHVTVTSHEEPDAADLQARVDLARAVAAALA